MKYYCWDEINFERDQAEEFMAPSPRSAAILYAENDLGGVNDGVYIDGPHPILVEDEDGTRFRVLVTAYIEPVFAIHSLEEL